MKKLLSTTVALTFLTLSSLTYAQLTVNGSVGAESNYIYRGESLSNKQPSANADLNLSYQLDTIKVFGNVTANSVNLDKLDTRVVSRVEGGAGAKIFGVNVEGGLRQNLLFGTGNATQSSRSLDYRELFIRGSMPVFTGVVSASYDRALNNPLNGPTGHDSYYMVGYEQPVVAKLKVGISGVWKSYDEAKSSTRFNNALVSAKYAVSKNVDLLALYSFGGVRNDVTGRFGSNIPSQASVGITYRF